MGEGGSYFNSDKDDLEFVSTGCRVLNCVVSGQANGGWVLGRIGNIVGDKSTGKTLLAIEACANFARDYPDGKIFYREAEAAFDPSYAEALGMPIDRVDFSGEDSGIPFFTVEDFFEDLTHQLEYIAKEGCAGLYIVDSLDALSDRDELERDIDKGSYGAAKAKTMSELFRRLVQKIENSRMCVIIISQVRDAIGVTFGDKTSRSGGRALDFYASQVVYLRYIQKVMKESKGVKRAVGIDVGAMCKKNKISLPLRDCEFRIAFGYGVDDLAASIDWLKDVKRLDALGLGNEKEAAKYLRDIEKLPDDQYFAKVDEIGTVVGEVWREVEDRFLPERRKY